MEHQSSGLPPVYSEYLDARDRAAVARGDLARRRALQEEIDRERRSLGELEGRLAREQGDVDALVSLGFRSILARIRGRLDEELTAEQAEVEAVRLEIAVRQRALAGLELGVVDVAAGLQYLAVGGIERLELGHDGPFDRMADSRVVPGGLVARSPSTF